MIFKILTYNVLDGGAGREALLLQVMQHARPDVVILEEVYDAPFVEQLGQVLAMQPFFGEGNRQRRVALLSRIPVESFQSHHPDPPIHRNFVEAELRYAPGKRLRVFGVHPMAGLEVVFQEAWRWWEARTILYQIRRSQAKQELPCLIGGDFNAIFPHDRADVRRMPRLVRLAILLQGNHIYRMSMRAYLAAGFMDCFRALNPQADGYTFPVPQPYAPLDHLLVNAALASSIRRCQVLTEPEAAHSASDHYPLLLELELD